MKFAEQYYHVAQAVMALVENDSVTGQDIVVDGGRMVDYV